MPHDAVTLVDPICTPDGDLSGALYGAGVAVPPADTFPPVATPEGPVPGEVVAADAPPIVLFPTRARIQVTMTNTGDRAIQVGSHFPLTRVNAALVFPRELAAGRKLDIAAGTAIRFEPGDAKTVTLVDGAARHGTPLRSIRARQYINRIAYYFANMNGLQEI